MNTAMPVQQRGLSFGGFIFGAFLLVICAIFGFRLIPAYIQAATIKNTFIEIAHDPNMQNASAHDIKESFNRHSSVDDITAINAESIDISSDGGTPVLSASYSVKIPVAGNISLLLEFNPSSAGK
ncbi:MAG: DUF4845 domain-containing protein [Gallionella sp.]